VKGCLSRPAPTRPRCRGRAGKPQIHDINDSGGPAVGILSALRAHPGAAWLVLACDLPFLTAGVLAVLIAGRNSARPATAFQSSGDGLPEPLCAIYEPAFLPVLEAFLAGGLKCPRKMLIKLDLPLLRLPDPGALDNVNEPGEFAEASTRLRPPLRLGALLCCPARTRRPGG
jgi:molybdopterin-guanine dinucleotide biosynthesis protein A